jgi:hypothetical protein
VARALRRNARSISTLYMDTSAILLGGHAMESSMKTECARSAERCEWSFPNELPKLQQTVL